MPRRRKFNDEFIERAVRLVAGSGRPITHVAGDLGVGAECDRPKVLARIRGAWALTDAVKALQELERLAGEVERSWPAAGASLREGRPESLALMRLGITGKLAKTKRPSSTCPTLPADAGVPARHRWEPLLAQRMSTLRAGTPTQARGRLRPEPRRPWDPRPMSVGRHSVACLCLAGELASSSRGE